MTIIEQLKHTNKCLKALEEAGKEYAAIPMHPYTKQKEYSGLNYTVKSEAYGKAICVLNQMLHGRVYVMPDGRVMVPVSDNSYQIYGQVDAHGEPLA